MKKFTLFFGKNRTIFCKIFQIFENQYKPPKYTSCPNYEWFEAFLAQKLQILSIFGPHFSLLIYKGMWWPAVIPCLALSAITFEPLVRFNGIGGGQKSFSDIDGIIIYSKNVNQHFLQNWKIFIFRKVMAKNVIF